MGGPGARVEGWVVGCWVKVGMGGRHSWSRAVSSAALGAKAGGQVATVPCWVVGCWVKVGMGGRHSWSRAVRSAALGAKAGGQVATVPCWVVGCWVKVGMGGRHSWSRAVSSAALGAEAGGQGGGAHAAGGCIPAPHCAVHSVRAAGREQQLEAAPSCLPAAAHAQRLLPSSGCSHPAAECTAQWGAVTQRTAVAGAACGCEGLWAFGGRQLGRA